MSGMADLMSLIENDIPAGRRNLQESHLNLEKVAQYCEQNYVQVWHVHTTNLGFWVNLYKLSHYYQLCFRLMRSDDLEL